MNLQGLSVLVPGGAGFIGSHLVDVLIREGCRVRVIDNLTNGSLANIDHHKSNKQFEFLLGTITDPFDVAKAMDKIDVVFNSACLGVRHSIKHPFENHRVNAEGTLLLLEEAMRRRVKKFIQCSSSEVYGTAIRVPMDEDHPMYPFTVYGASKLACESYARAYFKTYGFYTVVVRLFNTYGPRSHHEGASGEMIPRGIVRALNDENILIFGDGEQTRDFVYVEDTVKGLMAAASCDGIAGETFSIGSNAEISIKNVAQRILCLTQKPASKVTFAKGRPGDVLRLYANSTKLRKRTGWKPSVSFDEGLLKTIEWFATRPGGVERLLKESEGINWE